MRFILALNVVLLATGCGTSPTAPTGSVRVSGYVLAYTTNAGIPGATVIFDPSEGVFNGATLVPSAAAIRGSTDGSGSYSVGVPAIGRHWVWVGDEFAGMTYVTGSAYRGDFLVRAGTCVARYGTVTDADTKKPVSGATVSITFSTATAMSGSDGWYRLDLGCPANGMFGFNTTELSVRHPGYADFSAGVGRGVVGVRRFDLELQRR
jgi:hypothetical protein